ncbi:dihydrofolate reductase family protein [Microbacterium sp. cf332]|uniref:dihydrofolate reductase family protein n=1 Tax=Microbacterium sp. cf332 TaxID=1761804 RepID=UPI000889FB8F|nr:dihydrofolate reductase family protein [Microbacterium sp. cf332]SDQ09676.1 Dihydrofolate reductase [Microbacterium sp. cf332]
MQRIIYDTASSLDGFIADPDHSLAWLFAVDGGTEPDESLLPADAGALVEGSTTYEWILAESDILAHPGRWREFAGDRPTFVFTTRRLPRPDGADVTFVSGAVADVLPRIRAAAGARDVWVVGGGDLAGQFLDADALDRIAVSVAPVALGAGSPLLPRRVDAGRLTLRSARVVGAFARLVYDVESADGDAVIADAAPMESTVRATRP